MQRVVETNLTKELHHQQRMAEPEARVLRECEEEVEIAVIVAIQRRLLHEWLEQHANGDVRLLLQAQLHVAREEVPERRLVVVLDHRGGEDVEEVGRARVGGGGELVEEAEERHVRRELQLKVGVAAALLELAQHHAPRVARQGLRRVAKGPTLAVARVREVEHFGVEGGEVGLVARLGLVEPVRHLTSCLLIALLTQLIPDNQIGSPELGDFGLAPSPVGTIPTVLWSIFIAVAAIDSTFPSSHFASSMLRAHGYWRDPTCCGRHAAGEGPCRI